MRAGVGGFLVGKSLLFNKNVVFLKSFSHHTRVWLMCFKSCRFVYADDGKQDSFFSCAVTAMLEIGFYLLFQKLQVPLQALNSLKWNGPPPNTTLITFEIVRFLNRKTILDRDYSLIDVSHGLYVMVFVYDFEENNIGIFGALSTRKHLKN